MGNEERALAEAAASLTVEDIRYLEEQRVAAAPVPTGGDPAANPKAAESPPNKERTRRRVRHEWPEVGTVLERRYGGVEYEAEVIGAQR